MVFKRTIGNLIRALDLQQENPSLFGAPLLDHLITVDQERIGIEARDATGTDREIAHIARSLEKHPDVCDRFVLVTPGPQSPDAIRMVERTTARLAAAGPGPSAIEVLPLDGPGFLRFLGLPAELDLLSPDTQEMLRVCAHAVPLKCAVANRSGSDTQSRVSRNALAEVDFDDLLQESRDFLRTVPHRILTAARHVSPTALAEFAEKGAAAFDESFGIGRKMEDVFVVLSDFKNSSALARAARHKDLDTVMYEYYQKARDIAWRCGGFVDKFVGDGVAVFFNYPMSGHTDPVKPLLFASLLIELGRQLLDGLLLEINEDLETGTRIGITNGALRVMDLGFTDVELAFVGDVYNLAARLEKNAQLNGALIDQRTRTRMIDRDPNLEKVLKLRGRSLEPEAASGRLHPTKCWDVPNDGLVAMLEKHTP